MKLKFLTLIFSLALFSVNAQIKTPQPSPTASNTEFIGLTEVTLEYSRPSMRGRTIFGDLVPYGKVWRTGANANTKLTFSTDVEIGGKNLKKGTYALYVIPNKESWDVIFYSDASNWGLPQKWDDAKVALKTNLKIEKMPFSMETFTIGFGDLADSNSGTMYVMWDNVSLDLKINVPTDAIATKSIEATMAGPSANDYYSAGSYYAKSGKDNKKALAWLTKATEMNPDAFWMFRQKSLLQAKMGDKKGAIESAKKSLAGAEKSNNADYIKMNKESIAEWSKS